MISGRILALDIGERRIGLALSDPFGIFAQPFKTLAWEGIDKLVVEINNISAQKKLKALVIGIPYTLKGSESKKTNEIPKG